MKNYLLLKYFGIHVNLKLLAKVLFVIYIYNNIERRIQGKI